MDQIPHKTSVIIVSFNTREQLHRCLSCLDTQKYEVIVVDNASADGSADMVGSEFPSVRLLQQNDNLGFSKANNVGLGEAKGEIILFLNSDAYAMPDAVETLVSIFDRDDVVAAGGRLFNTDGTVQESVAGKLTLGSVFLEQTYLDVFARKLGRGYWQTSRLPATRSSEVEQVMGACLAMRKNAGERFDERFFLYCEDTELCLRLKQHGKIVYVPEAKFTHELGSSSVASRWKSVARYNLGKELYFRIHHGALASMLCWMLNRLGAILRLIAGLLLSPFSKAGRDKAGTFWRVLWATQVAVIPPAHRPR